VKASNVTALSVNAVRFGRQIAESSWNKDWQLVVAFKQPLTLFLLTVRKQPADLLAFIHDKLLPFLGL
jgi:hypothetical protein